MIVLDTNVVSELMRGRVAAAAVLTWLHGLPALPVTTVINRAEILSGIAILPPGRRRERLAEGAAHILDGLGVCLPFTPSAAEHYAAIVSARRERGRPIGAMDALIAAICRDAEATLATRDSTGFVHTGIRTVDPWQ